MGWAEQGAHASAALGWHTHGAGEATSHELHPLRCEHCASLLMMALWPPVTLCHRGSPARVHRGVLSPTPPTREAPPGAATSAPGRWPQRDACSPERPAAGAGEGMRCQAYPPPGSGTRASLPAQTRRSPASAARLEEAALAKLSPALPAAAAGCGAGGARPPPPTRWHRSQLLRGEKGLENGTHPRIGAERDGNPRSRGQPAHQPGQHFST